MYQLRVLFIIRFYLGKKSVSSCDLPVLYCPLLKKKYTFLQRLIMT